MSELHHLLEVQDMFSIVERPSPSTRASRLANGERTLTDIRDEVSIVAPAPVVIDEMPKEEEVLPIEYDLHKDLWISSSDGRFQSPIVPVRVGPCAETFYIHRDVLAREEYFRRALDGKFIEASNQAIDLPEENAILFSFVVAWMYERDFNPLVAAVSEPKGKEKENHDLVSSSPESDSGSESTNSIGSNQSERNRHRAQRQTRRRQGALDEYHRKQPDRHRPDCNCQDCSERVGRGNCHHCGGSLRQPVPPRHFYPNGGPAEPQDRPGYHGRRRGGRGGGANRIETLTPAERMSSEDVRTWFMGFNVAIDVYVCAERFLMDAFKARIGAWLTDSLERAGTDVALPEILDGCVRLFTGARTQDEFVNRLFARVGFLQSSLWKAFPVETQAWWLEHPEVGSMLMRECALRRGVDDLDRLPPMRGRVVPPAPTTGRRRRYVFDEGTVDD